VISGCKHERMAVHPLPGANWLGVCLECLSVEIVGEDDLDMLTPLPDGAANGLEGLRV
jgi:hypothetical protein